MIQSSTKHDLFFILTPIEVEQVPCKTFWRVDDRARMKKLRAGFMAQWIKHLLCRQGDMSLDPQNSGKAWLVACPCNCSVPMGGQEVRAKDSLEVCRLASMVDAVMSKRPCINQSARPGPTSEVAF